MNAYPLASPPAVPGIYMLKNSQTCQLYVGMSMNLKRRYNEWKMVFGCGLGIKSQALLEAYKTTKPEHWDFIVVSEFPGATERELGQYESRAIERIKARRPHDVINTAVPVAERHYQADSSVNPCPPKSEIVNAAGKTLSYRQAAFELGVTYQTVKKKLRALRGQGLISVRLESLRPKIPQDPQTDM